MRLQWVQAETAAETAAEVTRTARRPLTVARVGYLTETTMPYAKADQLDVMRHAARYALYMDWNRTPQTFRDAFRAVCAHTARRIREGRFGCMLDMYRIPLAELADTAKRASEVLAAWDGALGPGVIIPPGVNHHTILYGVIPDLIPQPYGASARTCGVRRHTGAASRSAAAMWSAPNRAVRAGATGRPAPSEMFLRD